jgi:hypothetical protein
MPDLSKEHGASWLLRRAALTLEKRHRRAVLVMQAVDIAAPDGIPNPKICCWLRSPLVCATSIIHGSSRWWES